MSLSILSDVFLSKKCHFQLKQLMVNYSITNYVRIPVFHFFEKVNKGQLKMVNVNH